MHENGGEAINEQQRKLKQFVEEATEKGRTLLNEGFESAKELIEEQAAVLKKKANEYGLDEAAEGARNYIRRNPWKSMGIAVALGLILGRITSSSEK